jgi:hypothetical protein
MPLGLRALQSSFQSRVPQIAEKLTVHKANIERFETLLLAI